MTATTRPRLLLGDVRERLAELPVGSVQCVVTSPPYWLHRDYQIAGQIGRESSIEEYIETLVIVFRAARRVLRDDGTLWIVIGDSYSGNPGNGRGGDERDGLGNGGGRPHRSGGVKGAGVLPPKNLIGVPWRLALALQEDGWWLRASNIWAKPSPMPDSVGGWRWQQHRIKIEGGARGQEAYRLGATSGQPQSDHDGCAFSPSATWEDCPGCLRCRPKGGLVLRRGAWRPTVCHEYVLLFSKSGTYYGDAEAVREPFSDSRRGRDGGLTRRVRNVGGRTDGFSTLYGWQNEAGNPGRNLRSVWATITPQPYPGEHYATFPEALPKRCILAGTSPRACGVCGAPWARVVDVKRSFESGSGKSGRYPLGKHGPGFQGGGETGDVRRGPVNHTRTLGWRATCEHDDDSGLCTVLDPFAGKGTTCVVAAKHGRASIGIELDPKSMRLAKQECWNGSRGLAEFAEPAEVRA